MSYDSAWDDVANYDVNDPDNNNTVYEPDEPDEPWGAEDEDDEEEGEDEEDDQLQATYR